MPQKIKISVAGLSLRHRRVLSSLWGLRQVIRGDPFFFSWLVGWLIDFFKASTRALDSFFGNDDDIFQKSRQIC